MTPNSRTGFSCSSWPFLQALLVVACALGLQLTLIDPAYETPDDIFMAGIVNGVLGSGQPSSLIMFSSALIGSVLQQLFHWAPHWPWYGLYLLAVHYVSHAGLLWVMLRIVPGRRTIGLFLIYQAFVGTHFLLHFGFTTTAFLAAQSGIALIATELWIPSESIRERGARLFSGILLLTLSSMIRMQMCVLIVALSAPMVLVLIYKNRNRHSTIRRLGVVSVVASLLMGSAAYFDHVAYQADSDWKAYWGLHVEVAKVTDYARMEFLQLYPNQTHQILTDAGWTENEFKLMKSWCYVDETVFSKDRIAAVAQGWSRLHYSSAWRVATYVGLMIVVVVVKPICLASFLLSLGIPSRLASPSFQWASRVIWLLAWAGMGYLYATQKLPRRVFEPIVIFSLVCQVLLQLLSKSDEMSSDDLNRGFDRLKLSMIVAATVLGFVTIYHDLNHALDVKRTSQRFWKDIDVLIERDVQQIVVWHPFPLDCIGPFDDIQPLKRLKLFPFSAFSRTPLAKSLKKTCDFEKLSDLAQPNSSALIASCPEFNRLLKQYLYDHCGVNVDFLPRIQGDSGFVLYEVRRTPQGGNVAK